MKWHQVLIICAFFLLIPLVLLIVKINVPLFYEDALLNNSAISYVMEMQKARALYPEEAAATYLYYKTDYHYQVPARIDVQVKEIKPDITVVSFHDPHCEDDSVYEDIHKIYLVREDSFWKPFKHTWVHKGRGRLGWTTKPTS